MTFDDQLIAGMRAHDRRLKWECIGLGLALVGVGLVAVWFVGGFPWWVKSGATVSLIQLVRRFGGANFALGYHTGIVQTVIEAAHGERERLEGEADGPQ